MTNSINADNANGRLEPLGYKCRNESNGNGYHVTRLYGSHFSEYFQTDEQLNSFIEQLERSDIWALDETSADADINLVKSVEPPLRSGKWYKLPIADTVD